MSKTDQVSESRSNGYTVRMHSIATPYQPTPCRLRIAEPHRPAATGERRVLYVLPVEHELGLTWGDGLDAVCALDMPDRLGFTVVAPSYSATPWYGDHPGDPGVRQESLMVETVVPFVEALGPCEPMRRGLLGFSKSGWGAYSLLLRHPDLFGAACSWDAPLMKDEPTSWGMDGTFPDRAAFGPYFLPANLRRNVAAFKGRPRFGLFGYDAFREHGQGMHRLMDELGVPHHYADGPSCPHRWDSGWVEEAVLALDEMTRGGGAPPVV